MTGRPGVGDEDHPRATLDLLDDLRRALGLVALVVGDQARARQLEPLVEQPGAAGVLAGDQVGVGRGPAGRGR